MSFSIKHLSYIWYNSGRYIDEDSNRLAAIVQRCILSIEEDFCPECGALLSETDIDSCPSCGFEFVFVCEKCDGEVNADAVVCPHCGDILEEDGESATAVSSTNPATKDDEDGFMAKCPECGMSLHADVDSCSSCGFEFVFVCEKCDGEVTFDAVICPHCGDILEESATAVSSTKSRPVAEGSENEEEQYTGECPGCGQSLYIEDGFCSACGITFCTNCVHETTEDDEHCPNCGMALYFNCPLCDFELTAGTEFCANCNALFPQFCTACKTHFAAGTTECPECKTAVTIIQRRSARIIHTVLVDKVLVHMVACPECGKQYTPISDGACPRCDNLICASCQINLIDDEIICPRCGFDNDKKIDFTPEAMLLLCPSCGKEIEQGSDECPHCQQWLCPQCNAAIKESDDSCPACGIEFELLCPACETAVVASTTICPNCNLKF